MTDAVSISLVVCTRNREPQLRQALESFAQIKSSRPWELVIVDNGSTDGTRPLLDEFGETAAIPVRVLSEPAPGLSRARNTGWRAAHGQLVAFTDDDCYPAPDFIDRICDNFSEGGIDYLGGRILLYDPSDYPITIQTRESRVVIPPNTFIEAGLLQGANMAARRSLIEALNGFDEMLGAGTPFPSEDVDFINRASFSGHAGVYDPRPVVLHHHRRKTQTQVDALRASYAVGRGAYYAKCILRGTGRGSAIRYWIRDLRSRRSVIGLKALSFRLGWEIRGAATYCFRAALRKFRAA